MNYNITTSCIYLPIIAVIMVKVVALIYTHSEVFLLPLYKHKENIVEPITNLLPVGYYLTSIGYTIITVIYWEYVQLYPKYSAH